MGVAIDPLGDVTLYWLWTHSLELCDCPAKHDDRIMHAESCSMTMIYADIVHEHKGVGPWHIKYEILKESAPTVQTVIKCAECGKERLAKDMCIVYKHWSTDNRPFHIHNILKAICPNHNRKGTISYQGVPPSGFGS